MLTLGIHPGYHDASACLFDGYRLVAAVSRERLTRTKGDGRGDVPQDCVDEVLAIAGANRGDVGQIASTRSALRQSCFNHFRGRRAVEGRIREVLGREKLRFLALEMARANTLDPLAIINSERFLATYGFRAGTPLHFANHHLSHALPSLFFTDWDDALLYTADGGGDNVQYSMRSFRNGGIDTLFGDDQELLAQNRIDSLGMMYGFCTQALGWKMNRHEGKLTGLAALGETSRLADMAAHFMVTETGEILSDFPTYSAMKTFILDLARDTSREDMAASVQALLEQTVLLSVRRMLLRAEVRHLGLSGGVFSNVRLNRLLAEETGVDEVFVFPAMADDGLCVGACLDAFLARDGMPAWLEQRYRLENMYLGRDHTDRIDRVLAAGQGIARQEGYPVAAAVARIVGGQAGAIYSQRMEFGPRALGARTILGSPHDHRINDELNKRLERSEFMPFAPVVSEERASEVFEISGLNAYAGRFMTITCAVRPEWRDRIPAVVHVDGSARPQIVRRDDNPLYHDILAAFERETGLPVLINTSFNVHEEPIVDTPEQCLRALSDHRIDFVVTDQAVYAPTTR
jgi:carbamoyltransferase